MSTLRHTCAERLGADELGAEVYRAPYRGVMLVSILGWLVFTPFAFLWLVARTGPGDPAQARAAAVVTGTFIVLVAAAMAVLMSGSLTLHEHGMIFRRYRFSRPVTVRWSEVTRTSESNVVVSSGLVALRADRFLLYLTSGRRVALRAASGHRHWPAISALLTEARYPQAVAQLRSGAALQFGPFTVSAAGIGRGDRRVPWSAVTDLVVGNGRVTVRAEGKRLGRPVGIHKISHFGLFWRIIEEQLG